MPDAATVEKTKERREIVNFSIYCQKYLRIFLSDTFVLNNFASFT